jgi:hypothetical protein
VECWVEPAADGPDLELVRIFPNDQLERDEDGQLVFMPGAVAEVVLLLMVLVRGGWLVTDLGGWLPRPRWPPQIEMIASPEDSYVGLRQGGLSRADARAMTPIILS